MKFSFLDSPIVNELLLVYRKFGIYINYLTGLRTRYEELMWSALPISTAYSDPYLFVYTEKSIDIYNIISGIWLQSFSLTNTYPLAVDGSISLSHDLEFEKNYGKLIYISEENHLTISLDVPEKILPKPVQKREGLFRSPLSNSTKSTFEISISQPTNFRHIEHMGSDIGPRITADSQNDERTSTIKRYLSNTSDENGAMSDNSFNQSSDTSSQFTRSVPL